MRIMRQLIQPDIRLMRSVRALKTLRRDVEETIRGYLANIDRFNDLARDPRTLEADLAGTATRIRQYEYVMRRFTEAASKVRA